MVQLPVGLVVSRNSFRFNKPTMWVMMSFCGGGWSDKQIKFELFLCKVNPFLFCYTFPLHTILSLSLSALSIGGGLSRKGFTIVINRGLSVFQGNSMMFWDFPGQSSIFFVGKLHFFGASSTAAPFRWVNCHLGQLLGLKGWPCDCSDEAVVEICVYTTLGEPDTHTQIYIYIC